MREILFRGKSKKTNKWVYGDFSRNYHDDVPQIKESNAWWCAPVIPETVGQYTGLTDKNGKKIFEGDIVKAKQGKAEDIATIGFENGVFMVYPVSGKIYERNVWEYWHNDWDLEVIGNIHDNPELLKGGAE